jgi:hypothetical protein
MDVAVACVSEGVDVHVVGASDALDALEGIGEAGPRYADVLDECAAELFD